MMKKKSKLFMCVRVCPTVVRGREASPCHWSRGTSSRATSAAGSSPMASTASWSVWWTTHSPPSSASSAAWVRRTITSTHARAPTSTRLSVDHHRGQVSVTSRDSQDQTVAIRKFAFQKSDWKLCNEGSVLNAVNY